MRKLALCLLALLLTALTACTMKVAGPEPWQYQSAEGLRQNIYRGNQLVAEITLSTLLFSGAEQAEQINDYLHGLWAERLAQHTAYAEQLLNEAESNGPLPPGLVYYTLEETPAVYYNDGQILSLTTAGYEYIQGTPHPMTYRIGYTFDAASGQRLTLADVWGEGARERAAQEIYAQVQQEGQLEAFYPSLAENLLQTLEEDDWYMDNKNLYIIYNPYEIAPYAAGIQEFTLPK